MANILIKGIPSPKSNESIKVKKTLQPIDREDSNMEIESGETVVGDFDNSGFPSLYIAGGDRHYNGGTPIHAPDNTFIFSRDKSLKLKNPEIQKSFGKKEKNSGYTFAEVAKQYDINEYRKILADPNTDKLQRNTAELMIKNYNEKLGKLALVQESLKGMPQGMPFISIPYLESMGIDPAQFVHGGDNQEPEVVTNQEEDDSTSTQTAKFGGMKVRILKKPELPKAQLGATVNSDFNINDVGKIISDFENRKIKQEQERKFAAQAKLLAEKESTKKAELERAEMARLRSEAIQHDELNRRKNIILQQTKELTEQGFSGNADKTAALKKLKTSVADYQTYHNKLYPQPKEVPVKLPVSANIAAKANNISSADQWSGKIPGVDYVVYNGDTLGVQKKFGGALDKYQKGGPKKLANGHWGIPQADGSTLEGTVDKGGNFIPLNTKPKTISRSKTPQFTQTSKVPVYTPQQWKEVEKQQAAGYEPIFPKTLDELHGAVDKIQKQIKGNVHGRKDWTSPELYNDFVARHKDYIDAHPEFDPTNAEEVRKFQQTHPGLEEDGLFGEKTYSTPGYRKIQQGVVPQKQMNTPVSNKPVFQPSQIDEHVASTNNPFWTQDLVNMAGAFGDSQRIKKYMPWQAGYNVQLPEGIYYDPTRELAANSEQANIAGQALSTYSGAQNTSARMSEINGQALENAGNILGKYNNLNVGIANQLEGARKEILNSNSANRADQATGLFDKTTAVNQNFDNAKAQARQNMRQSFINAWSNRGKTQALNSMNKQYRVNPETGYVEFTKGVEKLDPNAQHDDKMAYYNKLMENPIIKANPDHLKYFMEAYDKQKKGEPGYNVPLNEYYGK